MTTTVQPADEMWGSTLAPGTTLLQRAQAGNRSERIRAALWLAGSLALIISPFLRWVTASQRGNQLFTASGIDILTGKNTVFTTGEVLFNTSLWYCLSPIIGVAAAILFVMRVRQRSGVEKYESTYLSAAALGGFVVLMLRLKDAQELAGDTRSTIRSGPGLQFAMLGLFFLFVAGYLGLRQRSRNEAKVRGRLTMLGFLGPAAALVLVFFLIPVLILFLLSLTDLASRNFNQPWNYIGFDNYQRVIDDPFRDRIIGNTFRYVVTTLILFNIGLALLLAVLTTQVNRKVGFAARALWLLPRITPPVVYVVMWQRIGQQAPFGILGQTLSAVGGLGVDTDQYFLNNNPWVFVILINGFVGASFGMILFSSAIESIPPDLTMAAKVDGAGTWRVIRDVTLPQLKYPLLFVTAYQTLSLLVSFEYILLLTAGGPGLFQTEVWALTSYNRALGSYFGANQWASGAAWGFILVSLGLIMATVLMRLFRFSELVAEPKIELT